LSPSCLIAGGGPAGMMLGLLLARAGIPVQIFEKHADFLRDFRGDTIHPSTLEVMHELGLLERLLKLPHQKVEQITAQVGNQRFHVADFRQLPVRCPFVAFMPQWDFLDFLAAEGQALPQFKLEMQAEVVGVVERDGRIAGLRLATPNGERTAEAPLVIAADGRQSVVRTAANLQVRTFGAPIDVLWFRLSRRAADPAETMGRFEAGSAFVAINRDTYWQCGYVIPKDAFDGIRARGIEAFRDRVAAAAPFAADRVAELDGWERVSLLTVRVDRLVQWYRAGLLCIGDAAHAMSPVGGVGINLAIQDAVAAANLLREPLRRGRVEIADLARVQQRRELPTRLTQWVQVQAQKRFIVPTLAQRGTLEPPPFLHLLERFPILRRLPGRMIGIGVRPEHVERET